MSFASQLTGPWPQAGDGAKPKVTCTGRLSADGSPSVFAVTQFGGSSA